MNEETSEKAPKQKGNMVKANFIIIALIIVILLPLSYVLFIKLKSASPQPSAKETETSLKTPVNKQKRALAINEGLAYYNSKKYEEAIKAWEKALEYDPNSEVAYANIGGAYCSMGKWEEAKKNCEKALAISPNFYLAKNNLKWANEGLSKEKK